MLTITPMIAMYLVWALWIASWTVAAVWSSQAARRIDPGLEFRYRVLTSAGFILLLFVGPASGFKIAGTTFRSPGRYLPAAWTQHQWTLIDPVAWAMVALAIAGFAFAWWARIHLGALWSGNITRKVDHRIVDTGPYGLVRHPIYTGLLTAALAVALLKGSWVVLLGFALMTTGYWLKARFEEGFLRQELGAEAYDAYRKRVPMLIPLSPFSWL